MQVEIVYSSASGQWFNKKLTLSSLDNCSVQQAIELSGILSEFPEINLAEQTVGIFSQKVQLDHYLKPGDRIEIYRPLVIDPMTKRRLVAKKQKQR